MIILKKKLLIRSEYFNDNLSKFLSFLKICDSI